MTSIMTLHSISNSKLFDNNSLVPTGYPTIRSTGNLLYGHNTASWWTDGYSTYRFPNPGVYYEVYVYNISGGTTYFQVGLVQKRMGVDGESEVMSSNYINAVL